MGFAGPARADVCEAAAATAEREAGLPSGILAAIGRVESGGRGSGAGANHAWPWTVTSLGQGQYFQTEREAIAHSRNLLLAGVRSIDVGCFQINLQWHPAAFSSLEAAFDPSANARYAASFLVSLRGNDPEWSGAVARYHSRTEALGLPYGTLVEAVWRGGTVGKSYAMLPRSTQAVVVHVWYNAIVMPPACCGGHIFSGVPRR